MDLESAEEHLRLVRERYPRVEILAVSAEQGAGMEDLRRTLRERLIIDKGEG